jgi:putative tryptophan/tyrosine transport system substrate-binding protein
VKRRQFITLLGAAAVWPLAARAQSGVKSHRVSFLALIPREDATLMKAFLERLHELGYSEGTNLIFEYRSAEGRPERLGLLAIELAQAKPDVLVAGFGTLAAKAAKAATTTIPVVFTTVGDPLGAGIIANLGRPAGNVTGLTDQARTRTHPSRDWLWRKSRQPRNMGTLGSRCSKPKPPTRSLRKSKKP